MTISALVPNRLLARDAVELGRLVLDISSPEQDFYPNDSLTISENDIVVKHHDNFYEVLRHTKGSKLYAVLTNLTSSSYQKQGNSTMQIKSARNTTYQLKNSGEVFHQICSSKRGRKWLERAIGKDRSAYMVVGIQILTDAELGEVGNKTKEAEARVNINAATIQSGLVGACPDIVDVRFGGSCFKEHDKQTRFVARGEQIYAVQYRKVKFAWFSSQKVDKSFLESGNRWKMYWGTRGVGAIVEDDVLEADIDECLQESDLGSGYEVHTGSDGAEEVLYIACSTPASPGPVKRRLSDLNCLDEEPPTKNRKIDLAVSK